MLFVRGSPDLLRFPLFGIVGSRKPSMEGLRNAKDFSSYISRQGICIVSGLAYGIDRSAHENALHHRGKTIAVIGTGIDITYPAFHKDLADEILANGGAIISCFARGTKPLAYNFPARNRIISGISLGLLVVEAGLRSGAMITARYAIEQGREVFAIPGSIHHPLAKGTNALIKQGANLAESYQDIINHLRPVYRSYSDKLASTNKIDASTTKQTATTKTTINADTSTGSKLSENQTGSSHPADKLTSANADVNIVTSALATEHDISDPIANNIVKLLTKDNLSPDDIEKLTNQPMDKINATLLMLELDGHIYQEKGRYRKS